MLRDEYGISVELDFNYYPIGVWDEQDVQINGWCIDVKGTRPGGKWLLVEWNKLRFRKEEGKLPHVIVAAVVGWDRDKDQPTGTADIKGYCFLEQLKDGVEGTHLLKKGKQLPETSVLLQADNFGRRFCSLEKNWDTLLSKIKTEVPPDVSGYEIPRS